MAMMDSATGSPTAGMEQRPKLQQQPSTTPLIIINEEPRPTDPNSRPECFDSTFREILFVATTTMAISMGSITIGSNTVITSYIWKDLNMTSAQVTWIGASTSLTSGAFLLFFGRFADTFGRRPLLILSMGIFALLALGAGFARSGIVLDVLNGALGLCGAASVPSAVGALGHIYSRPSRRKNLVFACFSAGNPIGFVLGSVCSGVATKLFGWRASYWVLAVVFLTATLVAFFSVPKTNEMVVGFTWETVNQFDCLGALLTVVGFAMVSSSLSLGSDAPQGFRTPYVLFMLVVGFSLIVGFILWENFFKYPLMPLGIWRDPTLCLLIMILVLGVGAFGSAQFWLSLYMQTVLKFSALEVAVHLLPQVIAGITVNIIAGLIMHKVNNKLLMIIGCVSYTGSFLLLSLLDMNVTYWAMIFPGLVLTVIGADLHFNVANMYVMSSLPKHQQSVAGGIFNTAAKLALTIGLGISTAIYDGLTHASPSAQSTDTTGLSDDQIIRPYHAVWWFGTASAGCSLLIVWGLKLGTQGGIPVDGSPEINDGPKETSSDMFAMEETPVEPVIKSGKVGMYGNEVGDEV